MFVAAPNRTERLIQIALLTGMVQTSRRGNKEKRDLRSSLAARLLVLTLMCILPLAAILFFNLYSLRQSQERAVHEEAFRLGQVASLEMARIVGGVEDTLLAVAAAPVVRDFNEAECNAYVGRVSKSLPQFSGIAILDKDGVIRCLQKAKGIGVSLADKDYFKDSFTGGKTVLGRFTMGRVSKEPVLPVAVPIRNDQGHISGVVAGSLSLHWLEKRLTERRFAKDSSLTVSDGDGTIIARYPQPEKFVGTRIPEEFRHLVNAVAAGTLELTSQDGTRRILAYFPPPDPSTGLYVSVGLSTEAEYGAITRAVAWGLAVTFGAILIAFGLAWLTARHSIRRPVDRLVATVEAWRHGRQEARTGLNADDGEFGIVGKAIDTYMDELVAARGKSDLLMRELDHRVKNLLATVGVIMRQTLKSANVDPTVYKTLSARLSAMSNAHSILMKDETHTAAFREIVTTSLAPFENPEASQFRVAGADFTIGSAAALAFSMALHELCTNSVKYGALSTDGTVTIEWHTARTSSGAMLTFSWTEAGGPEVTPPTTGGFGTLMVERMLSSQLRGELWVDYAPRGLRIQLDVSTANLLPQALEPQIGDEAAEVSTEGETRGDLRLAPEVS